MKKSFKFPNQRGEQLAARMELPLTEPSACALFAHCFTCSKDIAAASRISRAMVAKGVGVLRFDFTGLGNSEGDFANENFSSNIDDLVAAADHMREEYQAPSILIGHSLGGAAVLAAAHRIPEVKAVVTIGAPCNPVHVEHLLKESLDDIEANGSAEVELAGRTFRISKQFVEDLADHTMHERIRGLRRALLVLHSPRDEIVSIDQAAEIYRRAMHPKSFISLDDADHLLTRPADSEYVAGLIAAWAARYVPAEDSGEPELPRGEVTVESTDAKFTQIVRAGDHRWFADEPKSSTGDDRGPTPYEHLLAGLGACTSMTLHLYARRKEWPLKKVHVRLAHDRIHAKDCEECEKTEGRVDVIDRELTLEGDLDEEQRTRLLEIADRCPVHRTLENEIKIKTRVT